MTAPAGPWPAVGIGLPTGGEHAGPAAVEQVATAADRLGFSSVSLTERLLLPGGPGWTNDFGLPDFPFYDPIETLAWVAAKTSGIGLRTDVVLPLFQQPVVLARRLATLDHLSGGRVTAGLAVGWMPEEFAATGVPLADRGRRFEDAVAAIRACWGPNPVEHDGPYYRIPPAKIGPKPLRGTIDVHIGALAPAAVARAARIGDGFTIGFRNWDDTRAQIEQYRTAGGTGRVVVRGGPMLADAEHATPPTTWTEAEVVDSLARLRELDVDEFLWDLNIVGHPPEHQVELMAKLAADLGLTPRPAP